MNISLLHSLMTPAAAGTQYGNGTCLALRSLQQFIFTRIADPNLTTACI
jgi:hypothetical protein